MIITFGREWREWCDGREVLEIRVLIDSQCTTDDAVMYTGGFVLIGQKTGWGFLARVSGKVSTDKRGAYQITSNMGMEIEAAITSLRWLSNTPVARENIQSYLQSML